MPQRRRVRGVAPELRHICIKIRYETQDEALAALKSAREDFQYTGRNKVEKRAYLHDEGKGACGKWHLTSMAKKPRKVR